MNNTIFVERPLLGHPRVEKIIRKYGRTRVVECNHYGEIFNRAGQHFRTQKQTPALILANKNGVKLYEAPNDHAIGAPNNYYFSHMLNCPFDCRYCYLQGKFNSANYVLFVNYEDFLADIDEVRQRHSGAVHVFAGYDCDSLAFEPVTGFVQWLVEHLRPSPGFFVELRTKSAQIRQLLKTAPNASCLVAYSLSPQLIVSEIENGTADLNERLNALRQLQDAGWSVGLRLDPLIDFEGCENVYAEFFQQIASSISLTNVHSVTLGTMRFPANYFKKLTNLYPREALFATMASTSEGAIGYPPNINKSLLTRAYDFFASHLDAERIHVHHAGEY